jgi:hypothetical protein
VATRRVAIERLAQQLLDVLAEIAELKLLVRLLDLDEIGRQLDALGLERAHREAHEARLVAGGAAEYDPDVRWPRLHQSGERRGCERQELRERAAVRAVAGCDFALLESIVLVYINRHGGTFLCSVRDRAARWNAETSERR